MCNLHYTYTTIYVSYVIAQTMANSWTLPNSNQTMGQFLAIFGNLHSASGQGRIMASTSCLLSRKPGCQVGPNCPTLMWHTFSAGQRIGFLPIPPNSLITTHFYLLRSCISSAAAKHRLLYPLSSHRNPEWIYFFSSISFFNNPSESSVYVLNTHVKSQYLSDNVQYLSHLSIVTLICRISIEFSNILLCYTPHTFKTVVNTHLIEG